MGIAILSDGLVEKRVFARGRQFLPLQTVPLVVKRAAKSGVCLAVGLIRGRIRSGQFPMCAAEVRGKMKDGVKQEAECGAPGVGVGCATSSDSFYRHHYH